jgi:transaldolase
VFAEVGGGKAGQAHLLCKSYPVPRMSDAPSLSSSRLEQVILDGIAETPLPGLANPLWEQVEATGTTLWLDTGDMDQAARLWNPSFQALTTNNSLLNKEIQKGLYDSWIPAAAAAVQADQPGISEQDLVLEIAFALNARHGLRLVQRFGARVSVELHTDLAHDVERSLSYGRRYAALCPDFIVKVPLTPSGLVAARHLEEEGIPVNFTLGFSARQNYLIASTARTHWVNVFLGRLNAYAAENNLCDGRWVGERATMASQAGLRELRDRLGVPTAQIAASMRGGDQVETLAGLDVYTMPVAVAQAYLDAAPRSVKDCTGEDYQPQWSEEVALKLEGMNDLWDLSDSFRAAVDPLAGLPLAELTPERIENALHDGGVGGLFPRLSEEETAAIKADGKAPIRERWLADIASGRCGLDGLFTLAGLYAFAVDQAALDARIRSQLS